MSAELQRLDEALYRAWESEPEEQAKLLSSYRRLFQDAAARLPAGVPHERLQDIVRERAMQIRRARKKHSSLQPTA